MKSDDGAKPIYGLVPTRKTYSYQSSVMTQPSLCGYSRCS